MKQVRHRRRALVYPGTQDDLRRAITYDPVTGTLTREGKYANHGHLGGKGYRLMFLGNPNADHGSQRDYGYSPHSNGVKYRTDHLVWFYVTGTWPDGWIEHVNGIRSDDMMSNLVMMDDAGRRWAFDPEIGYVEVDSWILNGYSGPSSRLVVTASGPRLAPIPIGQHDPLDWRAEEAAWMRREDESDEDWRRRTGRPIV